LAKFLHERGVSLIDGGTSSGVMALIGLARERRSYTFPLIGVTPERMIGYPGYDNPNKQGDLDAFHSHFVLVDGDAFGAESEMILSLADALSGHGQRKALGLIVNGGEIVRSEAHLASVGDPRFPLLILEGSGRFADELAAAHQAGSSDHPKVRDILDKGKLNFIPVKAGAENLRAWLDNFFQS
jgi:hypothetical protein